MNSAFIRSGMFSDILQKHFRILFSIKLGLYKKTRDLENNLVAHLLETFPVLCVYRCSHFLAFLSSDLS